MERHGQEHLRNLTDFINFEGVLLFFGENFDKNIT